MSALLHFVSRMVEAPQTMFGVHSGGGSLVFGIAESLLSIFTFRKTHQDFVSSTDLPATYREMYPLANQSLLLILILTNHCTAKSNNNQYRLSLFGCCDSKGTSQFFQFAIRAYSRGPVSPTQIRRRRVPHSKSTSAHCSTRCAKLWRSTRQRCCSTCCYIAIRNSIGSRWLTKIFSNWWYRSCRHSTTHPTAHRITSTWL